MTEGNYVITVRIAEEFVETLMVQPAEGSLLTTSIGLSNADGHLELVVNVHYDDNPLHPLASAVVKAQWLTGGYEGSRCPWCGADWYSFDIGVNDLERHAADCPVLLAMEVVGGLGGED